MIKSQQQFILLQHTINNQNMMASGNIRAQINHLNSTMRTQEKHKLLSQPEASTSIKGIDSISSMLHDDMPETTAISLRSGKVLDEPILLNKIIKRNKVMIQHNTSMT